MSLHAYGFSSSSPKKASRDEFATQRGDRYIEPSPRKRGLIEKDEVEEMGVDVSSEEESRLRLSKEGPIDLDDSQSEDETDSRQTSTESEVPARRRLVKGKGKAKATAPAPVELTSSDSDKVEIVGMSEKAKGKRKARSPGTSTADEAVLPVKAPQKKRQRRHSSEGLPEPSSVTRKLVRGKPANSSYAVVIEQKKRQRTETEEESAEEAQPPSDRQTRSAARSEAKAKAKSAKASSSSVSRTPRSKPKFADIDWSKEIRALTGGQASKKPEPPSSKRRGNGLELSMLSGEVDDGLGSSSDGARPRPSTSRAEKGLSKGKAVIYKPKKRRQKRQSTSSDASSDESEDNDDDDLPDVGANLDHPVNRNRLRKHHVKESPHLYESSPVPESVEASASEQAVESESSDDSALDQKVVMEDRLRPQKKKVDPLAGLKAARAKKAKRALSGTVELSSDVEEEAEEESAPVPKQKLVVDLASSSEEEEEDTAGADDAVDDFIVDDDEANEEQAAQLAEAKKQMPMQFTGVQSEPLKDSMRSVLLAFAHQVIDHRKPSKDRLDWFEAEPDFKHGRMRCRARIDEILPSMVKSSVWTAAFNDAVDTFPDFSSEEIMAEDGCDVCGSASKTSTFLITLSGRRYDRDTNHRLRDYPAGETIRFRAGQFCYGRALAYHELKHWEHKAYHDIKRAVGNNRPNGSSADKNAWVQRTMEKLDDPRGTFDQIVIEVEQNFEKARKFGV